jgi:hypothetical protein
MARQRLSLDIAKAQQDRAVLTAMITDEAGDESMRKRARLIVALADGSELKAAAEHAGLGVGTAREKLRRFNEGGWKALLTVKAPRGGDFLARYDLGYWAERLSRACLDQSKSSRAIPYGTSRSEPFTDMATFRQHIETEYLLQAWSAQGRWKRPDLLMLPRAVLVREQGNDNWTPDLQHMDNHRCGPYVQEATAAIEVETSLWQVRKALAAGVHLSFTVKQEDLDALRNWVRANRVTLFIVQVFYDEVHALPFATLEEVISLSRSNPRHVAGKKDRTTGKVTYMVPLEEGVRLGTIPEPEVEGRVFKAPNGKVTVYGRLVGSEVEVASEDIRERLASGTLQGGRPSAGGTTAAAGPARPRGGRRRKGGSTT